MFRFSARVKLEYLIASLVGRCPACITFPIDSFFLLKYSLSVLSESISFFLSSFLETIQ